MSIPVIHALAMWATLLGLATGADTVGGPEVGTQDLSARAMEHVSRGARLRSEGELMDACRHFRVAVGYTPTWPMARLELGRCLRLLGDPLSDAALHLKVARAGLPDRPLPLMELGRLAEDQGDSARARVWYKEAFKVDPDASAPSLALARLGCTGAGVASFEHARRLVRADASDPAARRALASTAAELGFRAQALEAYRWLTSPSRPSWRSVAALARLESGVSSEARVTKAASKRSRRRRRRASRR